MSSCNELLVDDEYTVKQVTRILINYWQLWAIFEPKSSAADTNTRVKQTRDGKRSARKREDLLCALLDVEEAIPQMPDNMKENILQHYILDAKDVSSEVERVTLYRCVQRLTRIMNDRKRERYG